MQNAPHISSQNELFTSDFSQKHTGVYNFAFNSQEKDDEIYGSTGTSYTAQFWQYDSRLGRRWNLDPKPQITMSDYACFSNNPVWFTDPLGDKVKGKTEEDAKKGKQEIENSMNIKDANVREQFMAFFKIGKENTFENINTQKFNVFINEKSGFTADQIALANGYLKAINAGYKNKYGAPKSKHSFMLELDFSTVGSGLEDETKDYARVTVGSKEYVYTTINGKKATSTQTQRFVHELLGEGFARGRTGDIAGSSINKTDKYYHSMDIRIIQTENIYHRVMNNSSMQRLGLSHRLTIDDKDAVQKRPPYLNTSLIYSK